MAIIKGLLDIEIIVAIEDDNIIRDGVPEQVPKENPEPDQNNDHVDKINDQEDLVIVPDVDTMEGEVSFCRKQNMSCLLENSLQKNMVHIRPGQNGTA